MPETRPLRPTTSPPIWDLPGFLQRLEGDTQTALDIIDIFREDAPARLRELQRALDAGDAEEAGRKAHSLKGIAVTIGGARMQTTALEAQEAGRAGDTARIRALLPTLQTQLQELLCRLDSWDGTAPVAE
ncbi:MAG: Hpt domain-containing protein [Synergistales bacterium]|nr:Hpt domain-containing protein [Synergistales bacterium]